MLKHWLRPSIISKQQPAAFRRLCVETLSYDAASSISTGQPPSGGCVLKHVKPSLSNVSRYTPAAFRRLCVETANWASVLF